MIRLRLQTDHDINKTLFDYPVVFEGTFEQCEKYAKELNYKFVYERGSMWDGYWANENGDCLIPT